MNGHDGAHTRPCSKSTKHPHQPTLETARIVKMQGAYHVHGAMFPWQFPQIV